MSTITPTISSSIEAVLFDLDGTLLDTAPDLALCVNKLRKQYDLQELEYDRIRVTVSHGARALITLAFGLHENDTHFAQLRLELLNLYSQYLVVNTAPFEGIDALLIELERRNIPWGVVTNKPKIYTIPILETLVLSNRCQSVVCPEDVTHTKPDPEPLFLACKQLQCEPINTVYIGDHHRDIEAGKRAGMTTIATAYGYIDPGDNAANWQADFCVNHATEIFPLLQPRISGI